MDAHSSHHTIVPYSTHIKIWVALVLLTALTVSVAGTVHVGILGGLIAFVIASVKALLVLSVFMHLKYEDKMFRVMGVVAIVTLVIIFALTFSDYLYRT